MNNKALYFIFFIFLILTAYAKAQTLKFKIVIPNFGKDAFFRHSNLQYDNGAEYTHSYDYKTNILKSILRIINRDFKEINNNNTTSKFQESPDISKTTIFTEMLLREADEHINTSDTKNLYIKDNSSATDTLFK